MTLSLNDQKSGEPKMQLRRYFTFPGEMRRYHVYESLMNKARKEIVRVLGMVSVGSSSKF